MVCGHARPEDLAAAEALFASASLTLRVEEKMIDAVTGLSGSGPAYLFYLVEAMEDAGVAAYLRDENTIQWDWLYSNMLGGVKVDVADEDVDAAKAVLATVPETGE